MEYQKEGHFFSRPRAPRSQSYQHAHSEEFAEPGEIRERYETLKSAHSDLEGLQVRVH